MSDNQDTPNTEPSTSVTNSEITLMSQEEFHAYMTAPTTESTTESTAEAAIEATANECTSDEHNYADLLKTLGAFINDSINRRLSLRLGFGTESKTSLTPFIGPATISNLNRFYEKCYDRCRLYLHVAFSTYGADVHQLVEMELDKLKDILNQICRFGVNFILKHPKDNLMLLTFFPFDMMYRSLYARCEAAGLQQLNHSQSEQKSCGFLSREEVSQIIYDDLCKRADFTSADVCAYPDSTYCKLIADAVIEHELRKYESSPCLHYLPTTQTAYIFMLAEGRMSYIFAKCVAMLIYAKYFKDIPVEEYALSDFPY